ncbi:MAG: hypothetical protein OXG24_13205 [Gammaproteobacteria bacterium]|nr:hypothetical protein [Gammaproteobacteria bacterium]
MKSSHCVIHALLIIVCFQPLIAKAPSFGVWGVDTTHATHDPIIVDVDGDGLKDLVVPQYSPKLGRELHIHYQEANAKLANAPLKIEIKSEAIGFSLADVRETPGTEILWITADAVYSYSARVQGYVGNLKHLLDWELFVNHPDSKELLYVEAVDLNADGARDLVLPGRDRFGVFLNFKDDTLSLVETIELSKTQATEPAQVSRRTFQRSLLTRTVTDIDDKGEVGLRNIFVPRSQYQSLFSEITPDELQTRSISFGSWQRGVIQRDFDGDGLSDLVTKGGKGIIVSHLKSDMANTQAAVSDSAASNGNPQNSYKLITRDIPYPGKPVSSLEDVDGDGDLDIVSINSGIASSTIHLTINYDGFFNSVKPSQVFRINGTVIGVEFEPIRQGENPLMLINTVTAPLRKLLTEIELHRNLLLFEMDESEKGVFNQKPSLTSTHSINIDSLRNLMPSTLRFDLDLDGSNDILECKSDGTVQALSIDTRTFKTTQPFWQFTPEYAVFSAETDDLNNDQLPDLILKHSTAVTYLVSRP